MSPFLRYLREKGGHALLVLPAAVGVARDERGHLLLIRHAAHGQWCAPAGCSEPDETPEAAIVREMQEETGLIVEPTALLGVGGGPDFRVHYPNGDVTSYVSSVFECRVTGGRLVPDLTEALEARFVGPEELDDLDLSQIGSAVLRIAMDNPRFANRFAKPS